jgi:amino acid transporter
VSVTAGVAALTSAFPGLYGERTWICLGILVLVTAVNLRGVVESAKALLVPTAVFVGSILAMVAVGRFRDGPVSTASAAGHASAPGIPAMFTAAHPGLDALNVTGLSNPTSAMTSAVIFNALIITALIPLALRGVRYRTASAHDLLRRNLCVYGLGGLILPFVGIKLIDLLVSMVPGLG